MTRHLLDAFLHNALHRPNAIAMRCPGNPPRTWAELVGGVNKTRQQIETLTGSSLRREGRQNKSANARLAYESRNSETDVLIALACIAAGVIEIPIDSRLPQACRQQIHDRCGGVQWDIDEASDLYANNDFEASVEQLEHCAAG